MLVLTCFWLIIGILGYPLRLLSVLQVPKKILRSQKNQTMYLYSIPVKGSCFSMKTDLQRDLAMEVLSLCSKKEVF